MMSRDDILASLPRLAQDYTPEQREACIEFLAELPLADLRQRQSIKREEIQRWGTMNLPEDILISLQEQEQQLAEAVGRPGPGRKSTHRG